MQKIVFQVTNVVVALVNPYLIATLGKAPYFVEQFVLAGRQ